MSGVTHDMSRVRAGDTDRVAGDSDNVAGETHAVTDTHTVAVPQATIHHRRQCLRTHVTGQDMCSYRQWDVLREDTDTVAESQTCPARAKPSSFNVQTLSRLATDTGTVSLHQTDESNARLGPGPQKTSASRNRQTQEKPPACRNVSFLQTLSLRLRVWLHVWLRVWLLLHHTSRTNTDTNTTCLCGICDLSLPPSIL